MAEKIVLAELNIDIGALIKNTSLLKKEIDALKVQQKELAKAGDTSSEVFVQNASDLKVLTTAYNQNIKAISAQTQATADLATREELLTLALDSQATSIAEAREQNKLLNKLRNETNVTTAEGIEQLNALNARLDENNEFIKENADAYLKQKINVGNYSESIKEAFNDLNIFNGGLGGFIERSKEAGGVGNLVKGSLTGMAQGFAGVTKASLAFIATPIGAVLAVLVGAFALVKNAMNRSEEATNKIKGAFSIFSGIINTVLKALEPLGEFLIDGIVMGLELAAAAAQKAGQLIADGLAFLGFEDASKAVSDFNNEIQEGIKSAKTLADAEAELEKAQRKARLTQLQFQKDAEKLRQLRDDETKSTQERINANEKLGEVLKRQLQEELNIANVALRVANLRIANEGKTKEALDAQLDALTQIADIEERITGQQSEQLANRNSLIKEANDKARELAQKRIDEAIRESKALIDLYIAEQGFKAKTLEDAFIIEQTLTAKRLALAEQEFEAGKKSRTEYEAEKLNISNEFLQKQAELTVDFAQRELQAELEKSRSFLEANKFVSAELLNQETERLNSLAEKRREFEATRLTEGVINETEYNDAINAINAENQAKIDEANLVREEAEKEKQLIDLENERARQGEIFQTDLDTRLARLNEQYQAELKLAEKNGADKFKIEQKYAKLEKDLRKEVEMFKVAQIADGLGQAKTLFKENTTAYKTLAIAEAIMNTYKAATAALSTQPAYLGIALAAITTAQGLLSVSKIAGVKFEKGGVQEVGGNRHAQGGTKFVGSDGTAFEAERGELIGVLNRDASKQFMDFNNAFGRAGSVGTTYAENGGIIARGMDVEGSRVEQMAEITAQLIASIPPPIVTVEDINAGVSRVNVIESGAIFG